MADPRTGSFTATGQSESFRPDLRSTHMPGATFNLSIWGTFTGTIELERSFDDGSTWLKCSRDSAGTAASFTAAASVVVEEPEAGVLYRLNATALSVGTANYRMSQ